jgi:hypothetical protein
MSTDGDASLNTVSTHALLRMIEAQRGRQRWLSVALAFSTVAWLLVVTASMAGPSIVPDEVTARTFRVLDAKGNSVIRMGTNGDDAEIVLFDSEHPEVARLRISVGVFGTPLIELLSPLVGADGKDMGSRLVLTNEGKPGEQEIRLVSHDARGRGSFVIRETRRGMPEIETKDRSGSVVWNTSRLESK